MGTPEKSELKWFVKENTHLTRGFMDFGWGNGYVCIPKGHPAYGLDYDEIHNRYYIDVSGGLTFARPSSDMRSRWPEVPEGDWWIVGFDTCHYGDSLDVWPKYSVEYEAKKLLSQLEILNPAE